MTTTRRFPKLVPLLSAAALTFAAAGCGDDDDGATCGAGTVEMNGVCLPIDYDASPVDEPDAAIDEPDATPDVPDTRAGFIAMLDVEVLGSGAISTLNWSGPAVLINYDVFPPDPLPSYSSIDAIGNGCRITMYDYDIGVIGLDETDEGPVTISGDSLAAQIGTCTYQASTKDYACINGAGSGGEGAVMGFQTTNPFSGLGVPGLPTYTFNSQLLGGPFTNTHIGMYLTVSGAALEGNDGKFPIVRIVNDNTVQVVNPTFTLANLSNPFLNSADYAVIAGNPSAMRIPAFQNTLTGTTVDFTKPDSDEVEAIDTSVIPGGQGWVMRTDGDYVVPKDIDSLDAPVTFGCDGAGCGTTALAMAVFGTATQASTEGWPSYLMPDQTAGNAVSFACFGIGATEIEIEQGIMDVLKQLDPTRIEFQVVRVNLSQVGNAEPPGNGTNVAAGFGYVGHADMPDGGW